MCASACVRAQGVQDWLQRGDARVHGWWRGREGCIAAVLLREMLGGSNRGVWSLAASDSSSVGLQYSYWHPTACGLSCTAVLPYCRGGSLGGTRWGEQQRQRQQQQYLQRQQYPGRYMEPYPEVVPPQPYRAGVRRGKVRKPAGSRVRVEQKGPSLEIEIPPACCFWGFAAHIVESWYNGASRLHHLDPAHASCLHYFSEG